MYIAEPTFPLAQPPTCRTCGTPGLRPDVRQNNPIGNAGRPYYICSGTHPSRDRTPQRSGEGYFITFDDHIGIVAGNPTCACGYTTRLTRRRDGDGQFYSCPIGRCYFKRSAPSLSPQRTQWQAGTNRMGIGMSGPIAELDGSQVFEADGDSMDWEAT